MDEEKSISITPGWVTAAERITELSTAINHYAKKEHGPGRRKLIRLWAEEIIMQCNIWDAVTDKETLIPKDYI